MTTFTATREQTIADLRAAANIQRTRGWTRGAYLDRETGKVCAAGAIRIAIDASYFDRTEDTPVEVIDRIYAASDAAVDSVRVLSLSYWNDTRLTSADEAAALLETVAAELETAGGAS